MIIRRALVAAARAGRVPGEVLTPPERAELMAQLVGEGLDVHQIAERTRWTPYTVARIKARLRLGREAVGA